MVIILFISHVKLYISTIYLQALQMEKVHDDFITKFQVFIESEVLLTYVYLKEYNTIQNFRKSSQRLRVFSSYEHEIVLQINFKNKRSPEKVVGLRSFRHRNDFMFVNRWSSNFGLIEKTAELSLT